MIAENGGQAGTSARIARRPGGVNGMAIDSISSGNIAPQLPIRQQPSNPASGTDNNAVRDSLQNNQQDNRFQVNTAAPTQTQTTNAVPQSNAGQRSETTQPGGTNDGGTIINTLTQQLQQQDQTQSSGTRNSAINYGANGAPNSQQNPAQSGRLVSLSV